MAWRLDVQKGCLMALLLCGGCQGTLSPQGRALLQNSYAASAVGNHQAVVSSMDAFLRDYGRSGRADEAYYLRGLAKYYQADRNGAQGDLNEALARTSNRELRSKAALALGDLAWDGDDVSSAAAMYEVALENMDRADPPADHARYRLGCVYQRLGRWDDADLQFSRVLELFPNTEWAARSGRRLHGRAWAIQIGTFDSKSRAEAFVRGLAGRGLGAQVVPVTSGGALAFVVQVGRYATWEQVTAALPSVRKVQPDAFVIATR